MVGVIDTRYINRERQTETPNLYYLLCTLEIPSKTEKTTKCLSHYLKIPSSDLKKNMMGVGSQLFSEVIRKSNVNIGKIVNADLSSVLSH